MSKLAILDKIIINTENQKVLEFLSIDNSRQATLISKSDKIQYTHEGLDDFLELDVPDDSKFILNNTGIFVIPQSGEIIAFEFGIYERAFKLLSSENYSINCKHIKNGLLSNFKILDFLKVSLRYFSNIYGDKDTVIDIRKLGSEWALGIYFLDEMPKLINEYYQFKIN